MKRAVKPVREKRNERYDADVLRSAEQNHMWINAFSTIRPTDDLKRQIGEYVLGLLGEPESTILSSYCDGTELLRQRCLVVRFNKS